MSKHYPQISLRSLAELLPSELEVGFQPKPCGLSKFDPKVRRVRTSGGSYSSFSITATFEAEASWARDPAQSSVKCLSRQYGQCFRVRRARVNSRIRPHSTDGPHEDAIESVQKQMDFHVREADRPGHTQNPRAAVSHLPAELLAEVFLHVVESGLQDDDSRFATRTFTFLRVCRRWNEVSVGFPRLWGYWVAGAVKAWPMFNSRSKGAPLLFTWRPRLPDSARDILMDPAIPNRIHRLDFIGTSEQLARLLGAFDSSPPSNLSSIRLQISPPDRREPQEHLSRFLSSSFPKLTRLDLLNFLPNFSSPILVTPNLTSLKLSLPYLGSDPYTLSQFSQILQRYPNLRELDLTCGTTPLPGPPSAMAPFALPRLVSLGLEGSGAAVLEFIDFIGMSSPLHDVIISVDRGSNLTIPDLASTMKKVLVAYFECQGSGYPRTINRLTVSYNSRKNHLTFDAQSRRSATSNPKRNFRFQFNLIGVLTGIEMVKAGIPLFPLGDIREFAADGFATSYKDWYGGVSRKMRNCSHLRLGSCLITEVCSKWSPQPS